MSRPINADQLLMVRDAVAQEQEKAGLGSMAERTRSGELDNTPIVRAAIVAVERVLGGMFE